MKLISILTCFITLLALQASVLSAEIKLKFGDPIKGTVVEVNEGGIVILRDSGRRMALPKRLIHEDSLSEYGFRDGVLQNPPKLPGNKDTVFKPKTSEKEDFTDQNENSNKHGPRAVPGTETPNNGYSRKTKKRGAKKIDFEFDDPSIQATPQTTTGTGEIMENLDKLIDRHLLHIQPHIYQPEGIVRDTIAQLSQSVDKTKQISDLIKFPQDASNTLHRIFKARKTYKLQVESDTFASIDTSKSHEIDSNYGQQTLELLSNKRTNKHSKVLDALRIAKQELLTTAAMQPYTSLPSDTISEYSRTNYQQNNRQATQRNYSSRKEPKREPLAWARFAYILWDRNEKNKWQIPLTPFSNTNLWMR